MKIYPLNEPLQSPREPRFTIEYEKELNPAQHAVVMAGEGPLLVIAGAGSGKTRTLVYRVARLIESGVPPHRILLLTFTRKAAQEMLRRVGMLLKSNFERIVGGTFHSTANSILRKHGSAIGLEPSFTILDRSDGEDIIRLLRVSGGYGDKEKRFPKKDTVAEMFSQSVNRMVPLEDVISENYSHFSHCISELSELEKLYSNYKRERMLLDYDDLLLKFQELLETQSDVRRQLSRQFQYILVDEYQDTNKIQARIIRLLCDAHENVMVVGDDAQSIYSFRGAHFKNIMDFPNEFPGTRIYRLEENYRSTQPILDLTNEIINRAAERYPKHLFTRKGGGELPGLVQTEDENYQSRFICQRVLELREEGVPLSEIAVLFRSSFHSFDLEIELSRRDIPFEKRGGYRFVETAHVKDMLAHLRVLANPLDAVSWMRLLMLVDGVGPKKAHELTADLSRADNPVKSIRAGAERFSKSARKGLLELAGFFDELVSKPLPPSDQIQTLSRYYYPILQSKYDDYPKRMRDLEHLLVITERYGQLSEFLADMALEPPEQSVSGITGGEGEDEKMVLSTIHSAKGLEWHTVFLIWLLDGKFPSVYAFNSPEDLEEERRLLYVAATRAKEKLFMIYPINVYDRAMGSVLSKPTRFLDGIPKDFFETWALVEGRHDRNISL